MWYGWIIWQPQTKWEKTAVLKYRQYRGPFDILNFLLVFSAPGDFVKPAQAVCLRFYDDTCFSFSWSQTFECLSYESSIATSATNLLPFVINMRLTSTSRSMIHHRQTALPAVFSLFFKILCLTLSSSTNSLLSGKGQNCFFPSLITQEIWNHAPLPKSYNTKKMSFCTYSSLTPLNLGMWRGGFKTFLVIAHIAGGILIWKRWFDPNRLVKGRITDPVGWVFLLWWLGCYGRAQKGATLTRSLDGQYCEQQDGQHGHLKWIINRRSTSSGTVLGREKEKDTWVGVWQ